MKSIQWCIYPFLRSSAARSAQPIWQSVRWKDPKK